MENIPFYRSSIAEIKNRPIFYFIWSVLVMTIPFIWFYLSKEYSPHQTEGFILLSGAIFIPVFVFKSLWTKLVGAILAYLAACLIVIEISHYESWVFLLYIPISLVPLIGLIIAERFKSIKGSLVSIAVFASILGTLYYIEMHEAQQKRLLYQVWDGSYSNMEEALTICQSLNKARSRNECFRSLASRERSVETCNQIITEEDSSYSREKFIQVCTSNVERLIQEDSNKE